ncbi:MAG: PilZ domain-containing protein [Proteobacteria bacterium]|nr:PilZ domain-containing protein [Pseudomonadota bacterium]
MNTAIDGKEKRQSPRVNITTWVRAATGGRECVGRIVDLSRSGAAIEIDLDAKPDERLDLDIKDVACLGARVVRPGNQRIAVSFEGCTEVQQENLNAFLSRISELRFG